MNNRAFTLIEVLIALALILALVGAMYGFLFDLMSARRTVLEHVRQESAAVALIGQLETALATCIVGDRTVGSGVTGDAHSIRVLSRGVAASHATNGVDAPEPFIDLQLNEYRFAAGSRRIEGRRQPLGVPARNVATETVDGTADAAASSRAAAAAAVFSPLEGTVHRLRFRYHDGDRWVKSFDSRAHDHLPVAVEVTVWFSPRASVEPGDEGAEAGEAEPDTPDVRSQDDPAFAGTADAEENPSDDPDSLLDDPDEIGWGTPDRVRVIVIPDARSAAASTAEDGP